MLLPCQTKFINYINVFWRDCVPAGRTVTWLQQCSENPEFGTTLARRLNQSRTSAVLQSNLIAIKFGTAGARRLNWALALNIFLWLLTNVVLYVSPVFLLYFFISKASINNMQILQTVLNIVGNQDSKQGF